MAPVKFDDLSKKANEVLSDDYQTSGIQFKAKQKTGLDGAVVTTTVDLFGKEDVKTPAKLSWKFSKPMGIDAICIDKLEMDKGGKFKLEASAGKVRPDLKLECKSDLVDPSKLVGGLTFTGIKNAQLKFETKLLKPADFTGEATYEAGIATCGIKCGKANLMCPDVGVRVLSGPVFGSILAKDKFSVFTAHCLYSMKDFKVAATYDYGGKKSGQCSVGCSYDVAKATKLKAKVQQDQSISAGVKHEVSKGFTVLAGCKYEVKGGAYTYGLQLSVE